MEASQFTVKKAVVDFGYGERKSSANGHLIVQDVLDALNIKNFFTVLKHIELNC